MHRFGFLRLLLRLNFPDHRLRAWVKHTPCEKYECDVCNPLISENAALW